MLARSLPVPPQVERQIEQMVKFIRQEAEEKANEIKVSAEEVRVRAASLMIGVHGPSPPEYGRIEPSTCAECLQEFNLEKLQLVEQEKAKIRKEYERREAQVEVKKKM